ncbi:MAG TPA: diacylglycerol kinase family protein [Terriglobia bacterium]
MNRKVGVIVNPYAARGRAGKLWPQMAMRLRDRLGHVTVRWTSSTGHATGIARELIEGGFDLIVAVGGDGTVGEVVNGFMCNDWPIRPEVQLGILPVGTGADFQRTIGIPSDMEAAIEILASGRPFVIDVGKVKFVASDGQEGQRYFVNLTSFGMGGAVAAQAKNLLTAVSGKAAFFWATLKTVATYRGRQIEIEIDGNGRLLSYFITNVAVGNGRFHGGGMQPCPRALLNDGLLDVTIIDYLNPMELVRDIHVLYSEDVYRHPKAHHLRARRLVAQAPRFTWIEVDGEPLGRLPLEIEVLPGRLNVLLSPSSPHFEVVAEAGAPG